jgi:hypothetical protein
MQAWIKTEEDLSAPKPNGGYYLRSQLYSYEPKMDNGAKAMSTQTMLDTGTAADADEVPFV